MGKKKKYTLKVLNPAMLMHRDHWDRPGSPVHISADFDEHLARAFSRDRLPMFAHAKNLDNSVSSLGIVDAYYRHKLET